LHLLLTGLFFSGATLKYRIRYGRTCMVTEIAELPEEGELVIATVKEVTGHGAYVSLDEYNNMTAFLHISEIATGWIRNVERYVRPKQKTVLKVIRVHRGRVEVDLSLKQVSGEERKSKLIEVKKGEKASAFMDIIKKRNNLNDEQVHELEDKVLLKFDYVYDMFEIVARKGIEVIKAIEIPDEIRSSIEEESKKIQIPEVEVRGTLEVSLRAPNGINLIKDILSSVQSDKGNAKISITYIAAPKYRITSRAENFKIAEKIMNNAIEKTSSMIEKKGGTFRYTREDSKKRRDVSN
jgi:translation initiation factor 2 subunit 1